MRDVLTAATAGLLGLIASMHLYWALGGRLLYRAAIPSIDGVPLITPSPAGTVVVALAIAGAALVVAAAGGIVRLPLPSWTYVGAAALLALVFAVRAVGDFGIVGFFKTRGDNPFAQLDTWVYSPLCLILAAAIAGIVVTRADRS